jgi:signal transduction histidine kinase
VQLSSDVAAGLPAIDVDPVRIGEVLANLLANAVRHAPAGGAIVVTVASSDAGLAFAVGDDGPGIAPEQLPHVFDRFTKAPDSPGAGLGLAIAKTLVEAHDGTIRAASGPTGTTISFVLPTG